MYRVAELPRLISPRKWGKLSQTNTHNKASLNRESLTLEGKWITGNKQPEQKELYLDRMTPPAHGLDLYWEGGGSDTEAWFSYKNAFKLACLWIAKNREPESVRVKWASPRSFWGGKFRGSHMSANSIPEAKKGLSDKYILLKLWDVSMKVGKMEMPQWKIRTSRTQRGKHGLKC